MEVFNRLKNAVSNALPGNPMSREFDIYNQVASGGPGMAWKIYAAMKKSTKQEAAVFVFEKKTLERHSRRDRDLILEALKKGVHQLTRLRHPKVLSVMNPLEESRETMAFATEPIIASLANVLGNHENLPSSVSKELGELKLFEVEIKHGLLQVIEGVQFLHNDAKMMHHNLCPQSIILNKNGTWKLFGFDFCIPNSNTADQAPLYPFKEWDPELHPNAQSHLDFLAPEYALTMTCSTASDMFSVGQLIVSVFNQGKPLFECCQQFSTFTKNVKELRNLKTSLLGCIPNELREYVQLLLNVEPTVRPDASQIAKIPFFEDVGCMTLQYMDSLFQRENLEKSQFFKGLPKIIEKLPKRVNLQRILPALLKECVNPDMVPFTLPSMLLMAQQCSDKEYVAVLLPELIPLFKIQEPIQVSLIFLQNMNILLSKTPQADVKMHILPMLYRALEANNSQIQELCLSIIPSFVELIDYSSLKNALVPRIKKLCMGTSVLTKPSPALEELRVNALLCLGKLLEHMDKWYVLDEIVPLMMAIPSREPAVLMTILGIFKVTMSHPKLGITKDVMATKALPFLIPLSIDSGLNLQQFNAFMQLIREMMQKVESEHRGKLEQLDQMKKEQKTLEITKITGQPDPLVAGMGQDQPQSMMDKFLSGFGLAGMMANGDKTPSPERQAAPSSSPASTPTPTGGSAKTSTSLSLAEKQQLAKQQQQEQNLKKMQPLQAKASSASTGSASASRPDNQPKDLTASLMNSNLAGLQSASPSSRPMSSGPNYNISSSMAYGGSGFASSPGQMAMSPGMAPSPSQPAKKVDLSAFDSLLPGSGQSKVPMNQMAASQGSQPRMPAAGAMGFPGQTGMMGSPGPRMMGANPGMMGGTPGMMGGTPGMMGGMGAGGFGQQPAAFGSMGQHPGMMSPMGMGQAPMSSGFGMAPSMGASQGMLSPQNNGAPPSKLNNSDLADFLG